MPSTSPSTSRLRAWLELCRISNLPTVWTNVLVGSAILAGFGQHYLDPEGKPVQYQLDWRMTGIMCLAMSLFYIGGMALNDLADADIDAVERPGRPIPSGRVRKSMALSFIMFVFFDGLLAVYLFKPEAMPYAVLLLTFIVAYDFLHKHFAASVLLMGACRMMVVLAAASVPEVTPGMREKTPELAESLAKVFEVLEVHFDRVAFPLAGVLGLYIVGITVIARGEVESKIDQRKWLAIVMPLMVLAMIAVVRPFDWRWAAMAGFVLSMWLAQSVRYVFATPPKTIKAVLTWLSGICLVDAYFLGLLGAPWLALIAGGCFVLTVWAHRKILGT